MHYKEEIIQDFYSNPPATANEAADRIFKKYNIKRSPTQIRNFLHKTGFTPRKVGHIPAKADPEKQKIFHDDELMPRIEAAKKEEQNIVFMDAAHMVWTSYLGVLWCIFRVFIQSASGRVRVNILGAYDPIKNILHTVINKTYITSETVCEMLRKLKAEYGDEKTTVVLDNAPYQRCNKVKDEAKLLGIELLFLPTYSPNLNLIERLWRFVKKDVLYNKYYATSADFENAVLQSLDSISLTNKDKIKTMMNLKFQLFDKESIQIGVA
jgi:transposase